MCVYLCTWYYMLYSHSRAPGNGNKIIIIIRFYQYAQERRFLLQPGPVPRCRKKIPSNIHVIPAMKKFLYTIDKVFLSAWRSTEIVCYPSVYDEKNSWNIWLSYIYVIRMQEKISEEVFNIKLLIKTTIFFCWKSKILHVQYYSKLKRRYVLQIFSSHLYLNTISTVQSTV